MTQLMTVESLTKELSPVTRHLLSMESRIRLYPFVTDLEPLKAFMVKKTGILIPYVIPNPEHEIAHAVEMQDQSRWLLPDWGLGFPKESAGKNRDPEVKLFDRHKSHKTFFAAMVREIRVRAIQLHLQPNERDNKHSTVYNILNNSFAWGDDECKRHLPFGRFKTYSDVQNWSADLRDKTYKAWSLDRITHEWSVRLDHMRNYMDTKVAA